MKVWLVFLLACALAACRGLTGDAAQNNFGSTYVPVTCPFATNATLYLDTVSGNDNNTCITSGSACKSVGEIARREGCGGSPNYSPTLPQATALFILSDQTSGSDVWSFHPQMVNGDPFWIVGTLITVSSGTMGTVTPLSQSAGTLETVVLGGTPAAGNIVENTNHPGRAWIDSVSGGTATITTPQVLANTYPTPLVTTTPSATWVSGDSFVIKRPVKVNMRDLVASGAQVNPSTFGPNIFVTDIWDLDDNPGGSGGTRVLLGSNVIVQESRFDTYQVCEPALNDAFNTATSDNVWSPGGAFVTGRLYNAGAMNTGLNAIFTSVTLLGRLDGNIVVHGLISTFGLAGLGQVYDDNVFDVEYGAVNSHPGVLWGPAVIDASNSGHLFYKGSGGQTATNTLLVTGALKIDGLTTACSTSPVICGLALNVTNLDLPIGSGGFGGSAFNPATGSLISNGLNDHP